MVGKDLMVTIPLYRYEQLLDMETRVDVAVERITNDKYIMTEGLLRIFLAQNLHCKKLMK